MKTLLYTTLFILVFCGTINAQSGTSFTDQKVPSLNGHVFQSTTYPKSSFVATSLQADLGFGTTSSLKIPGIVIDDYEILSFEGKILFFNMDVQYQQRFTPWLALFFNIKVAGRVGTDMATIMADGVNTLSGGDIGWLIRIMHNEKFNLAGTVKVNTISGNFINVSEYFEDIINNHPNPAVIKKVPAMSIGMGARGAYAFNPTYGIQFQMDYAYGESLVRSTTKGYFSGGLMGDVNFLPKNDVPIGLALGYTLTTSPAILMNSEGASNLFLFKIGYTGSSDFELGLQYTYYNVKLQSVDENPFISKIVLGLKFYF